MEQQVETSPAELSSEAKMWGMLAHLGTLSGYLTGGLGWYLAPIIVWIAKKDDDKFIIEQCKESLNFQISLLIYLIAIGFSVLLIIGILLIPILFILPLLQIIFVIIASVKANNGESYLYPFTIRFIK